MLINGFARQQAERSNATEPSQLAHYVEATYTYCDEHHVEQYRKVRLHPKGFYQEARGMNGVYVRSLRGVRRVLYRLPELLAADMTKLVFFVEGEKDVERLRSLGLVATTAGSVSDWRDEFGDVLRGRSVVILPDNDPPGRAYAEKVASSLIGKATTVKVVELTGLEEGGDVSDWLDMGNTIDDLPAIVEAAPLWEAKDSAVDLVEAVDDPHRLARVYLSTTCESGERALRYWHGQYWRHSAGRYAVVSDTELTAEVNLSIRTEFKRIARLSKNKKVRPVKRGLVNDTLAAVQSLTLVASSVDMPAWIDKQGPWPAQEVLATRTAIVHLPSLIRGEPAMLPATSRLFSSTAIDHAFDPHAAAPTHFLAFLLRIFDGDLESIRLLQEWFGYCLTADTRQQKILFVLGPPRSGKGTIARVLGALLGENNLAAPTLSSLATNFGLSPLIGRSVAIISDARISGRTDTAQVTERLLSISGEDRLTIDRKNRAPVTMKLATKLMIISNELPRLSDASGAFADRLVFLQTCESFLGREDIDLELRLLGELPGILLWATAGWQRLHEQGRFSIPSANVGLREQIADLASPIHAFLRDECEFGDNYLIPIQTLFRANCRWCEQTGNHPKSVQQFGRDMQAAVPGLEIRQPCEHYRQRCYVGVRLRESGTLWHERNGSNI